MARFFDCMVVKDQICNHALGIKGVVGIGVGYCNPENKKLGAGIVLYVDKNFKSIKSKDLSQIKISIHGKRYLVPLRIVKRGRIVANVARFEQRVRPVIAGYSIGYPGISGTAGLIVKNPDRARYFILSNNHVLNRSNSNAITRTIQPGGADGGNSRTDLIGRKFRYVKLNQTRNFVDVANSIPFSRGSISAVYALIGDIPGHYTSYRVGWNLKKVGRTTGFVRGTVESVNTDVLVDYGDYGGLGTIPFLKQTIISSDSPISLPGDSSSVWLNATNNFATAVNYAGSSDGLISVSFPIDWAMRALNLRTSRPNGTNGRIIQIGSSAMSAPTLTNKEEKFLKRLLN